jgi:hypothetical protein
MLHVQMISFSQDRMVFICPVQIFNVFLFMRYLFLIFVLAGWSVLATPFLMSPILYL